LSKKTYDIEVGLFAFPVPQDAIHSVLMILVGLAILYFCLVRSYASILPNLLRFDTYFDQTGIERLMGNLNEKTIKSLNVAPNWSERTHTFHLGLIRLLKQRIGVEIDPKKIEQLSAKGMTTFIVEKEPSGFQRYRTAEVDGYLLFDIPTKTSHTDMRSFFALNSSQRDRFFVTVADMLFRHKFMLSPLLRQTYTSAPGMEYVIEDVIAITWVRFFPIIDIGDTLYLAKDGDAFVPIGYCTYKF
jgi:hypothetical protein